MELWNLYTYTIIEHYITAFSSIFFGNSSRGMEMKKKRQKKET